MFYGFVCGLTEFYATRRFVYMYKFSQLQGFGQSALVYEMLSLERQKITAETSQSTEIKRKTCTCEKPTISMRQNRTYSLHFAATVTVTSTSTESNFVQKTQHCEFSPVRFKTVCMCSGKVSYVNALP